MDPFQTMGLITEDCRQYVSEVACGKKEDVGCQAFYQRNNLSF